MQGASAIEHLLESLPQKHIRVLMVWAPVLPTDTSAPGGLVLARAHDTRVQPFWDPQLALSPVLQPVLTHDALPVVGKPSLVTGKVVWDFVGVYPPGVTWQAAPPAPIFKGAPVAKVIEPLRAALPLMALGGLERGI